MSRRSSIVLGILVCLAAAGPAAGTTVALRRDGIPADEPGEVCRFRAGDRENPFHRWLSSQELTCAPAGSPVEFPAGLWNVFARTGRAVSPSPLLVDAGAAPESLSLDLEPAATVVPLLPPGGSGVIYVPRRGSAFPVAGTIERLAVPAGEELWLFVLEKSVPVALVPVAAIDAGSERRVDARSGGPPAIIGWLRVHEADRAALTEARGISPPVVRAGSGGPWQDGDPLPPIGLLHGAFIRVREVGAGEAELIVEGRGWVPDRRRTRVGPALTIAGSPLTVRAAATLIVHWSAAEDLPALDRSLGACDEREKAPPRFEISLSACAPPPRPREPVDPRTCSVVRQETFGPELTFGSFTAEDILPGFYRAEMRFGKLPPAGATASVRPLEQRDIRVNARYFKLYGSVTRGGEPIEEDAAIHFPSGYGFASRKTGEYRAALLALLGTDALISVSACGAGRPAIVLADRPARPNSRFDIDIPANELTITVTDTFTRELLGGASVRMAIMSLRIPRREVTSRSLTADDEGRVVATEVPERDIVLTVSHSGYQRQQVPPFSLSSREKKGVEVQLVPLRGSRGRILSSRPFDDGWVLWFSPSGVERERAELAADGTFVYGGSRSPDETMAVVSRSHPLWVARPPALERRETIALRFPDAAPAREFDVAVAGADPGESRHIGIAVADVRVPQPAFRFHQTLRGLPALIRGSGPLRIRDLAETGPIEVLLGPTPGELPGRMAGIDLFALPQFAGVPRRRLAPGATVITFELP